MLGEHERTWYEETPTGSDRCWWSAANAEHWIDRRFDLDIPDRRWMVVSEVSAEGEGAGGGATGGRVLLPGHDADGAAGHPADQARWAGGMVHAFGPPDSTVDRRHLQVGVVPRLAPRHLHPGPEGIHVWWTLGHRRVPVLSAMQRTLLLLWLAAYTVLPFGLVLLALIFAWEGFASLRSHPENVGLALASALFLVAWPLSVLAAWVLFVCRQLQAAAAVSAGTAGVLTLLWGGGLLLAALVGAWR